MKGTARRPATGREYHRLAFSRTEEVAAFVAALSRFLDSPRGASYRGQPVEVWTHAAGAGVDLYISEAALTAATSGFGVPPVADTRQGDDVPTGCSLAIGSHRSPLQGSAKAARWLKRAALRPLLPSLAGLLLLSGAVAPAARRHRPILAEATAVFAGGCFWGVESVFEHLRGVHSAVSGFSGGTVADPSYERVSTGNIGHVESVKVVYDPAVISYRQLLEVFFLVAHDPTQRDRQGPDAGPEYRAIAFYRDAEQRATLEAYVAELARTKAFPRPIVTEIRPLGAFYPAEAYHQDYAAHHPNSAYIVINDAPKIEHLRKAFPTLYREPDVAP